MAIKDLIFTVMKTKLLLSVFLSFYFCLLSSQVPQGMNYQALTGDAFGNPIRNTDLQVRIGILSDTIVPVTIWEELHPVIRTNAHGVFSLVVGTGSRQATSIVTKFSDINWTASQLYIKTQIYYQGSWKSMGSAKLWTVPYSMVAGELSGAVNKLAVTGNTNSMDEALFEVKNKNGQTVFAVYNEGVRIYVDDGSKGSKGGFSIGGFGTDKGTTSQPYFVVNSDSIRAYIDTDPAKGKKGGFSIGGFDITKSPREEYLRVTRDSTRIYVNDTETKAAKGGFSIGGFNYSKGMGQKYFVVNPESIRAYIDSNPDKGGKGGFSIGGFDNAKGGSEEYLRVTRDSTRIYLNNENVKGAKGGFSIGGFSTAKSGENEYLSVTMDSVKVSKSLLIPRLTSEERDNLSFIPGEALIIFNLTEGCMQIYKNKLWSNIWCFNCAPDFIIQPVNQTICSGEKVVFFVSATGTSLSYLWQESTDDGTTWINITNGGSAPAYIGAKTSNLTMTNIPVGYNSNKYRCVVAGSCLPNVISNAVTLNVGSNPPIITTQPSEKILSTDCNASFIIESPGYNVSYVWQQSVDGGNSWISLSNGGTSPIISGSGTSVLSLTNVSLFYNHYRFRCIVGNLCGEEAISSAAELIVNLLPEITVQPQSKLVYIGQNITFNIILAGNGYNYKWQQSTDSGGTWTDIENGGSNPEYTGAETSELILSNVPQTCNNYKFRCRISHFCRLEIISDLATLSVDNNDPINDIDGNIYGTVGIGSQLWMAENLKATKYSNGDVIGTTTSDIRTEYAPKYQWAYNDNESIASTYGRLYTGYAVSDNRNICPIGWHVSTFSDWVILIDYLSKIGYGFEANGNSLSKSLASKTGWTANFYTGTPGNDQLSNNSSGFTALPAGFRDHMGGFGYLGTEADWWLPSALPDDYSSPCRIIDYSGTSVMYGTRDKTWGFSVRCVKD
jgi:uncharacterized protein (TIGR02145 family)